MSRETFKEDPINPLYYKNGSIEVSDFIADKNLNFFCGNVVKYVCRAGKKSETTHVEDLMKAQWYLNRELSRILDEQNKKNNQEPTVHAW